MIKNMLILLIILFFIRNSYSQEISSGNNITASKINEKFNNYKSNNAGYGFMPVGSIVPFHQSTGIGLSIPEGWVSCDGSQVSVEQNGPLDPDGNGLYIVPNINSQVYANGKGRYLRGGNVSGNFNKATAWDDNGADYTHGNAGSYYGATFGQYYDTETHSSITSYKSGSGLNPEHYRMQVTAMTVIYIMRVK
jgi:hypothetical protein